MLGAILNGDVFNTKRKNMKSDSGHIMERMLYSMWAKLKEKGRALLPRCLGPPRQLTSVSEGSADFLHMFTVHVKAP
jgi:hypothetical protein